jgi:hypothetical protein
MKQAYVNFRELKAAVPIRSVLERYGILETLTERGEALSGSCPFCEGQTSFRANPGKNCFHCFSCKAGGNMLDLVALREDCSVREAALRVAGWFGVATSPGSKGGSSRKRPPKRESEPSKTADKSSGVVPSGDAGTADAEPEGDSAAPEGLPVEPAKPASGSKPLTFELKLDQEHPWLAGAGLLPETVREFGLGFCSKGMMAGRVCFPLRNSKGELLGYAGRWPGDDPPEGQPLWRYPKDLDLSRLVYPAERLAEVPVGEELLAGDPLRVVLCRQMGLEEVFFVPGGSYLAECLHAILKTRS